MKLFSLALCGLALLLTGCRTASAGPTAADQSVPRLTVELRDGSRVIGQSVDGSLEFHSALLGSLKLKVEDLRSIDCQTTNSAKLTTTNGDMLAGWFVSPNLRVNTGFGRVELPVESIRQVQFSSASGTSQLPGGLVALWSGEGDGLDSVGGNTAMLTDISFVNGKVGRAFAFNGTSSHINIPDNPILDVGRGEGFTVMAWVKPTRVNGIYSVIEWNDYLCAFEIGQTPSDNGVLIASVYDSNKNNHFLRSGSGTIIANEFQHIALTYDKSSGIGVLYLNGSIVARSQLGNYVPLTKGGLRIGYRPSNPGDWTYNRYFSGLMDELAIYSRALSAEEIRNVGIEENHGEALPPPSNLPGDGRWDTRF